jgi:hypothetical protein
VDQYTFTTLERVCKGVTSGLRKQISQNTYYNLYSYLNFDETFNAARTVNIIAGYSVGSNNYKYLYGFRRYYASDLIKESDAGSTEVQTARGNQTEWALMSFFGRLSYNYMQRYLLDANIGCDGSSRLSPDSRWGWK